MSRNNPKGSIQTVVAAAYKAGFGIEQASADIGLSISTLSQHTEIPHEGSKRAGGLGINYVDRHCRASAAAAAVYAEHFAGLAGGVFQPIAVSENVTNLFDSACIGIKECGEAEAAMVRAAQKADAGSFDEADREIDEAVRQLLEFKALMRAKRSAA